MEECAHCKSTQVFLDCGAECGLVSYCSEQCAVNHYPVHKIECKFHLRKSGWETIQSNTQPKKGLFETQQMSGYALYIKPLEGLPLETHPDATQFFLVVQGSGASIIGGKRDVIEMHSMFYIPPGTPHTIEASREGLKLLTIYAPADHTTHTE